MNLFICTNNTRNLNSYSCNYFFTFFGLLVVKEGGKIL